MTEIFDLLVKVLSVGGNSAMIIIALALYKIDRRLLVVETRCGFNHPKESER